MKDLEQKLQQVEQQAEQQAEQQGGAAGATRPRSAALLCRPSALADQHLSFVAAVIIDCIYI